MKSFIARGFNIKSHSKHSLFVFLLILGLIPLPVFAAPPDAGQILSEQTQEHLPLQTIPDIGVNLQKEAVNESVEGSKVKVHAFRFVGDVKNLKEAKLQQLLKKHLEKELSFSDLQQAAESVSQFLRNKGYRFAKAYLTSQEIKDGVVEITILLGKIEEGNEGIIINGTKLRLKENKIRQILSQAIKRDPYLKMENLERGLLILNDYPEISARASLEAGKTPGTTQLTADVIEGHFLTGNFSTDNFGNRYTGSQRYSTQVNVNDPFGRGDQATIDFTGSDKLNLVKTGYSVPLGFSGLRVGGGYTELAYQIGKEFADLHAHGIARTANANASYPFIRTQNKSLYGTFDYEYKALKDVSQGVVLDNKRVNAETVALNGNLQDTFVGGGLNYFRTAVTTGDLDLARISTNVVSDQTSAKTQGGYTKFNYNFVRLQRLFDNWAFFAAINGQVADKNLDSSEKFILGGPAGVRAYPVGEGSGDQGWVSNLELRYDVPWKFKFGNCQLVGFYDTGDVVKNRRTWSGWNSGNPNQPNHYNLSGTGVGLNFFKTKSHALRLSYAWTLGSNPGQTAAGLDSDGKHKGGRFWLQFLLYF